ncbi:MAG: alpha/beta hydrolase [Roseiflexaceae bacterium]|nr:alpha/beta hydrolase [Roseiflexaceae bacterium]
MSSWQTGNVHVNGVNLHYTRTGGDKPAVVLAHGFSDSGLCWTPVAQALPNRLAACVAADYMPGTADHC